jgi:hypothetical protein
MVMVVVGFRASISRKIREGAGQIAEGTGGSLAVLLRSSNLSHEVTFKS